MNNHRNPDTPIRYDESMMDTLVNNGVYDASEVGHLLGGRHIEQIIRWSTPDAKGNPALVTPSHQRAFAFVDLVSLAVVAELYRRDVSEVELRRGLRFLEQEYGFSHPLAHKPVIDALATSGGSLLAKLDKGWFDIGKGGQGAFEEIIRIYLKAVGYDDLGVAAIWRPSLCVVLDPRIQAGAPCVEGTRIPTATIVDLLLDDSAEEIAEEYGLTVKEVNAAREFELRLSEGIGIAA